VLNASRMARMFDNQSKNGAAAYTVADMFNDLRGGIFNAGTPDEFKRNLQRGYVDKLKSLLNDDASFSIPGATAAQLAGMGLTPINIALSDIRPMVRAELTKISAALPKGGDALTTAHYADLRLRIKEALYPTRPVINIPGGAAPGRLTDDAPKADTDCFPQTK
jgi:hypothetical protein